MCSFLYTAGGTDHQYGVLVFRKTGLDDERHVQLSQLFGDLDDITPFIGSLGQVNRLSSD